MVGRWQKSFNKIPQVLLSEIDRLDSDDFVVSAVRKIEHGDILAEDFAHLGIALDTNGQPSVPAQALPRPEAGPWAQRNESKGWTRKFRDRPKVEKSWTFETPNFGDWSKGSHSTTFTKKVYETRSLGPPGWLISMVILEREDDGITVGFELDAIFRKSELDELELFFAINVFQESIGQTGVRATTQPFELYRAALAIHWEILPPGEVEEVLRAVEERLEPSEKEREVLSERMRVLLALSPRNLITGSSGFARYFGAQFADDLVVFENVRYGNAAYVMFDDWERLSQLSRLELLASNEDFQRVVHGTGWERKLREIVRGAQKRRRRG